MLLKHLIPISLIAATGHAFDGSTPKPKQGVFVLSNQPTNEVGVYESMSDGSLSWVGSYQTGGIGYPDPTDERNLDDLGSSNSIHYHVWNNQQWLLAANAGGPEGDASISLMEINPYTLDLELTSKVDLMGIFTCSVTAYEDRVCAVTCAGSVTMECFRINNETNQLEQDYLYDFNTNLPPRANRTNAVSAALGPGNILFSGDGQQVGIIMKGDFAQELGDGSDIFSAPPAGFVAFPVNVGGEYGEPVTFPLPDESEPFAFSWRSGELGTANQIVLVVNIAGESLDFPECDDTLSCKSSVLSLETEFQPDGSLTIQYVDDVALNTVDGCWIDYRFSHWYTGNFLSDSISIGTVQRNGTLAWERNVPIGTGTIPNAVEHMGRKEDGSFYLYSENQGKWEVGVHRVVEHKSFQLVTETSAPMPTGETGLDWRGAMGLATTLLSEDELFDMYETL